MQGTPAGLTGSRESTDDHIGRLERRKYLTTQGTKSTPHAVALHSTADCLCHDETEPSGLAGFTPEHMEHGVWG